MVTDTLKRWLVAGLGLAVLTKEKAEEIVQDLVKQGQVSKEEGRELLESLTKRAESESSGLRQRVGQETRKALESAGLAHREELAELEARVTDLQNRVARLEEKQ